MRSARSFVNPSKFRSLPAAIVSGVPLWKVAIADTVQSRGAGFDRVEHGGRLAVGERDDQLRTAGDVTQHRVSVLGVQIPQAPSHARGR